MKAESEMSYLLLMVIFGEFVEYRLLYKEPLEPSEGG
jgi:hypothetical protein